MCRSRISAHLAHFIDLIILDTITCEKLNLMAVWVAMGQPNVKLPNNQSIIATCAFSLLQLPRVPMQGLNNIVPPQDPDQIPSSSANRFDQSKPSESYFGNEKVFSII